MDEISKNRVGLIRSILVLTICIISCTIFLANHKAQIKLERQNAQDESEILDPTTTNAIEIYTDSVVDRTKLTLESVNDMFRVGAEIFTDDDNLKTMSVQTVTLLGYLENNPTEKLGTIEGLYTCKDNTGNCLQAGETKKQNDGTYKFTMPAVFTLNQNKEYYISLLNDDSMSQNTSFRKEIKEIK